jgi:uncharacterized protein YecE (DUF72 family)
MATILIGTSGYSYKEWVGPVYPLNTKASQYLEFYQELFATVELNFSYYKMPQYDQLNNLTLSAPRTTFSIKAHQSLTHKIEPSQWHKEVTIFSKSVSALAEKDALDAILLQFPHTFRYEVDQRRYLDRLIGSLASFPLAVEFRNEMWYNNRTLDALRKREVSLVSLDLPQIKNSPPMVDVLTSSFAYIRLHGRNKENWWNFDTNSRYDYLYTKEELEVIKERIKALSIGSKTVLVYFNNHNRGQAVTNALMLRKLLVDRGGNGELSINYPH